MRSGLSSWICRIAVILVLLASLKSAQFTYDTFLEANYDLLNQGDDRTLGLVVLWNLMSTPLLLCLIALSLILRSGTAVWLVAWLILSGLVPLLVQLLGVIDGGLAILLLAAVVALLLGVSGVLVFLIRSGELRKP
ncbi:hypothetical protein [Litoreibacter halocynthiae]|uniref:hypothetical protein n=1 Tax=Litoreibacter halocynthiae TaxID=1242689 RepID=UPI0024908BCF|nr:hypothetical protein [Litoreibacter halocynthiae]